MKKINEYLNTTLNERYGRGSLISELIDNYNVDVFNVRNDIEYDSVDSFNEWSEEESDRPGVAEFAEFLQSTQGKAFIKGNNVIIPKGCQLRYSNDDYYYIFFAVDYKNKTVGEIGISRDVLADTLQGCVCVDL